MERVAIDTTLPADELLLERNLRRVDLDTYGEDGEMKFIGDYFNTYWKQIQDNGDLGVREQTCVLKSCRCYILEAVESLFKRFRELFLCAVLSIPSAERIA